MKTLRHPIMQRLIRVLIVLSFVAGCALMCASCNSPARVTVTTKSGANIEIDTSGRIGGKGGMLVKSNDAMVAVYDNNDASFREGSKTLRFITGLIGLSSIANSAADALTTTNASNNAATLEGIKAVEATKQAKIAADAAAAAAAAEQAASAFPAVPLP